MLPKINVFDKRDLDEFWVKDLFCARYVDNFWVQCTNLTPKKNYGFLNKKTNWLNTILRKNNFRD